MNNNNKKLFSISEVAKKIGLVNKISGKPSTHTLRFWEKHFKQIRPLILNGNRRYYSSKDVEYLIFIKYLLKKERLTIEGAKLILKNRMNTLDDSRSRYIKASYLKDILKKKSYNLLKKIKEIKNNGKKNTR